MSSRDIEESNLYELTKKERVIYLAQEDPFLKVDKIAQLAETTSHYVRTVIYEDDLSFIKLRKSYSMKKAKKKKKNKLLVESLELSDLKNIDQRLQENMIFNQKYDFLIKDSNKLGETILFLDNEVPLFISSIFFSSPLAIEKIEQLKRIKNVNFSPLEMEVQPANKQLVKILNLKFNNSLLTLKKEIYFSSQLRGINVVYFPANQFKLNFDDVLQSIKVIKK